MASSVLGKRVNRAGKNGGVVQVKRLERSSQGKGRKRYDFYLVVRLDGKAGTVLVPAQEYEELADGELHAKTV